jgi:hypothetical protein
VVEEATVEGGWGSEAAGAPAVGVGWARVGTAEEGCVEGVTRGGRRIMHGPGSHAPLLHDWSHNLCLLLHRA